jgi:hypothetical protein
MAQCTLVGTTLLRSALSDVKGRRWDAGSCTGLLPLTTTTVTVQCDVGSDSRGHAPRDPAQPFRGLRWRRNWADQSPNESTCVIEVPNGAGVCEGK